jgi:hypothetical protein
MPQTRSRTGDGSAAPSVHEFPVTGFGAASAETPANANKPAIAATMMRISASIVPPGGNMRVERLYNLNGRVNL